MDLLDFSSISFDFGLDTKRLYQYLNQLVGEGISNDTFTILNRKLLWLVNDNVLAVKSEKVRRGVVRMYSGVVSGIFNQVKKINFCVHSDEQMKYSDYIEKSVSGRQCNISFVAFEGNYLKLSSITETVVWTMETKKH
jgi:hypothetical protein